MISVSIGEVYDFVMFSIYPYLVDTKVISENQEQRIRNEYSSHTEQMARLKSINELLKLRDDFCECYKDSTGEDIFIEIDSKYQNHLYFDKIRDEVRFTLGEPENSEILDNQTFQDFLFDDEKFRYYEKTINIFRNYVKRKRNSGGVLDHKFFVGALVIDERFKKSVLGTFNNLTPNEFYVAKETGMCQWFGILKDNEWDVRRPNYDNLLIAVISSFKSLLIGSNIVGVVSGISGSGKSTTMRRLAADCLNQRVKVLWVSNLRLFEACLTGIERDVSNIYLLLIDVWEQTKINQGIANSFLNKATKIINIRIVIADQDFEGKEYSKYFDKKNIFDLLTSENSYLIREIIKINPNWNDVISDEILNSDFGNNPLYIILYVIAHSQNDNLNHTINVNDFLSQFILIIENDLKRIYNRNPGAALSLYYFAHLYKEHSFIFTWEDFKIIANNINSRLKIKTNLVEFNRTDDICFALSNYINFENFIIPSLEKDCICQFHHDLLPIKGLANTMHDFPAFSDKIVLDIFKTLFPLREIFPSRDMIYYRFYSIIKERNIKIGGFRKYINERRIKSYNNTYPSMSLSLPMCIQFNKLLKSYFDEADKLKDEKQWELNLIWILLFFDLTLFPEDAKTVIQTLISKGCDMQIVHKVNTYLSGFKFTFLPHRTIFMALLDLDLLYDNEILNRSKDEPIFQNILSKQTWLKNALYRNLLFF